MTTLTQLMNLEGRSALITGGAGHIGEVMAETLAEMGAHIIVVDRDGVDYSRVRGAVERLGRRIDTVNCDLELQADRDRLMSWVHDRGQLDVLINNAAFVGTTGLTGWGVPLAEQTIETWRRAVEVNLTAAFDLCKGLAPLLQQSPGGSIINVASIYGAWGPDYSLYSGTTMGNPAAYAASKGGLIQLSRWLATTLAPRVRVNTITPGGVSRNQQPSFVERYTAKTPLGRMATEDDFRGAVAYLASDLSAYVTGHNLAVDGGWGVW